jgi:hypothetical protein
VSAPHSPLPPEPPPSIELVHARLNHAIVVLEVVASRMETWDDRIEHVSRQERALSSLARRLGSAALKLSAARLVQPVRSLAAMSVGAFLGGMAGSLVWQWMHAAGALAHP